MTHPDDEIAICAWIKRLTSAGAEVFLAWTHSVPVREQEARAVAAILGVPAKRLRFFGAPDRVVVDQIPALVGEFERLMAEVRPDRVCCGAFEQGHLDHDATNYLVNRAFDGPVLEIPFYHTYLTRLQTINRFATADGQEILHLTADEQRLKKQVARQYPSQNIWSVLVGYEAWQATRLRRIELARTERMRLQTHRDFLKPNLPDPIARRIACCGSWKRWVAAIESADPSLSQREAATL